MTIIHDTTRLDVAFMDKDGVRHAEIALHIVPEELFFTVEEIRLLGSRLSYGERSRCVSAATNASLSYAVVVLDPEEFDDGLLFLGPFLVTPFAPDLASRTMYSLKLPLTLRQTIEDLYRYIPHVGKDYTANLASLVHAAIQSGLAPVELIDYRSERPKEPIAQAAGISLEDEDKIKTFFKAEKVLQFAVSSGNLSLLQEVAQEVNYFNYFKFKVTKDTLRAAKNLSIGFNELLRLAAFDGGANPILLHTLTWEYVRATESAQSIEEIFPLHEAMAKDFLRLVQEGQVQNLGGKMREVAEYIDLHLHTDLSLGSLAAIFELSPQNLAYRFRKELDTTFSEYVNRKRIAEASWHLTNTNMPIKEIASLVGYRDISYFTQVFRASKGIPPKRFRRSGTPQ